TPFGCLPSTAVPSVSYSANSSKVLLEHYQNLSKDDTIYATILERKSLPIHQTGIANLHIAPSHILVSNTDVELTTAIDHREARLKDQLDKIKAQYDYVIIDCPPALPWLTINAFTASDGIIVVISPGYFELDSIVQISRTIANVQNMFAPSLKLLGYLFTMSDQTLASRESLKILRQTYTDQVFNTVIPRNTDIREAHMKKQDVFSYNVQSKSAEAYKQLISEVFYGEKTIE
ncbi:MAG TPA: ParA family protein, partial [Roseiflexaceae bacterium]|nr:ParA family protein [Roseiflexaceae bacterium]